MRRIVLFVCLLSAYSLGQGGAATGIPTITNTRGEPVPYATVAVCVGYPGAVPSTPCGTSTLATIATDLTLTKSCTNSLTPPGPISGTGCSNPGKSDGLGNIVAFATPGLYWCQYSGGSIIQPLVTPCFFANGTGGGIPFACASAVNGSIVGMTSTTTSSCDPNGVTDFIGHWTSQSYRATGSFNGTVELTGGLADPTNPPDTNSVAFLAPLTVPTPYYLRPPTSAGTVGQLPKLQTQVVGTNGTVDALDWLNAVTTINGTACSLGSSCSITVGGTVEFQTNNADNANCTAGACPLQNLVAGSNITLTNTSGGNVTIAASGSAAPQASNPSAPTVTPQGTTGATSYCYVIVGYERDDGSFHSAASAQGCTSTGNATLTTGNNNLLTAYADTLYGYRNYVVCRVSGGASQGKIATGAWKKFADTGLVADGTNCPSVFAANNTQLDTHCLGSSLPVGLNVAPGTPCGIDAPPTSPNALDYEGSDTFGFADTNDPFWTALNKNGATFTLTGGVVSILGDTTRNDFTGASFSLSGLSTPYTIIVYEDALIPFAFAGCGLFLRESSTGKMAGWALENQGSRNSSGSGYLMGVKHWTSFTASSYPGSGYEEAIGTPAMYLKIQNDGTNLILFWSDTGNGASYNKWFSEALTTPFTTAPDSLAIGPYVNSGLTTAAQCNYDFVRFQSGLH